MDRSAPLGIGMLGNGFMARAHTKALQDSALLTLGHEAISLVSLCGRDEEKLATMARHYGYARYTTNWRSLVSDPDIDVIHNVAPNRLHHEPTIAALQARKHLLCEKPLAPSADAAYEMWNRAVAANVVHMCGYNFRFVPAVRLAYDLVKCGEVGEIVSMSAHFLETWPMATAHTVPAWDGAIRTMGAHIVDLATWLIDDPIAVIAAIARPSSEAGSLDDSFKALIEFPSGAIGTLEGSRIAGGTSSDCGFRIEGTRGALVFTSARLNELRHIRLGHTTTTIDVTRPDHPFMTAWWPEPGHSIGWADTFTHEVTHLLRCVSARTTVRPTGADFQDGYRCAEVCDAIARAAAYGKRERVAYRTISDVAPESASAGPGHPE